jgi:alkylation response protein AidB-like acyl-CoA dehydrogenase
MTAAMTRWDARRAEFAELARRVVAPAADAADRDGALAPSVLTGLAEAGVLGGTVPAEYGGRGLDPLEFGLLCAEVGSWCTASRSLLTVQDMVATVILRCGDREQRARWLPALASGAVLAGFALTEPEVGSDAGAVTATLTGAPADGWVLRGRKQWVTMGAVCDVYLVIARVGDRPTAVLVDRACPGVVVEPVGVGVLGLRAGHLAHVTFDDCRLPGGAAVGPVGAGFTYVAGTALDRGRYSVAWGCAGLAEGCVREAASHAGARRQFGAALTEHQLVRRLLSEVVVSARTARQVCRAAGEARMRNAPEAGLETMLAKYVASSAALSAATNALQVHGAAGCVGGRAVERFYRDAKVHQIIEGTDEMHQLRLCELALREYGGAVTAS